MVLSKLKLILAKEAVVVKENQNTIEYNLKGTSIFLITDVTHNRMRLMSPVIDQEKLKADDFILLMEANFDRALDVRYALFNGVLWSVFIHPLKELESNQLTSALYQVKALVDNYGTSYSSSEIVFGGN